MRLFDSCRRRYYYHHYLKWDGWNRDAEPERQVAYRLSKMTSLELLCGDLVHKGILEALLRFKRNGALMSADELVQIADGRWKMAIAQSRNGSYRDAPSKSCCLMEDYYKQERVEERIDRAWARLEGCLRNFHNSKTWRQLQKSDPNHWLATDGDAFKTADIDGVAVHGRPDFGYKVVKKGDEPNLCRIFDWKTGKERDSDVRQLCYYALYAQHVWGYPAESVRARLVYLYPELIEIEIELDPVAIADALRGLRDSNESMREVLADEKANIPLDIAYFPVTNRASLCRNCAFQEICTDRPSLDTMPGAETRSTLILQSGKEEEVEFVEE